MAFPRGLKFKHRVAEDADGFYFDCYRSAEHPANHQRFRVAFDSKADRDLYITRHDALYHDPLLAQQIAGDTGDEPILGEIIASFLRRLERRWKEGDADVKTLVFYRKIAKRLLKHLGADLPASRATSQKIMAYDEARRREESSTTRGAMIKKEVSALGTMYRDFGIAPPWVLGRGAIRAKKNQRVPIGVEKIIRFILAMEPESLERDFTTVKVATGLRNEELYAANVGHVDLAARELEYRLRNKQGEIEQHVTYLSDIALEIVARRVGRRSKHAPLFELDGRRLTYTTLRKRFEAASKRASAAWREEDPHAPAIAITAVGQLRHEAATEVLERLDDVRVVQQQYGHRTQKTTETHYILPSRKQKIAASKRFSESMEGALKRLQRKPRP